jgi:hypothetical protein
MKARIPLLVVVALAVFFAAPALQAVPLTFTATLTGPKEDPPNASPGIGFAEVTIDTTAHTLEIEATFEDLLGFTTAAHIHCCTLLPLTGTAGVATQVPSFTGFPLNVQSGNFFGVFDLTQASSFNPNFINLFGGGTVAGAEMALFNAMVQGRTYFNVHTSSFGGGEIRGFLQPIPEPATLLLLGSGLGAVALRARRRRS